jgi:NAD+ synthase (glutamine-hydrolysing)
VDIILNPSASHFALGKSWIRKRFVVEGSRAFGCAYVFANLLGNEAGRVIYDGDRLIASGGRLITQGERLTFDDYAITEAVIDVDENRTRRIQTASTKIAEDVSSDAYMTGEDDIRIIPEDLKCHRNLRVEKPHHDKDYNLLDFTKAVSLGLYDYMRKSHSNGFILSLSGGVDSTACAVLVREMIEQAEKAKKAPMVVQDMMTCVYQATKNSSPETEAAARSVAEGLGFNFVVWNVEKLVEIYSCLVEAAIGRDIEWETDDMAMQNIQARVRAPGIWMLANIHNALLLTTSNRSEAAVGYATMDGDTCGGLAPIAGIGKPFLQNWLSWISDKYPCVKPVLALKPTAELRPNSNDGSKQTDEDDLMPYVLLEQIQQAAIRDKLSPDEVWERLHGHQCPADCVDEEKLRSYIDKFFTLWHRNQWKRERYAPAFHVDDESLDPKTWCRFPILSGRL